MTKRYKHILFQSYRYIAVMAMKERKLLAASELKNIAEGIKCYLFEQKEIIKLKNIYNIISVPI